LAGGTFFPLRRGLKADRLGVVHCAVANDGPATARLDHLSEQVTFAHFRHLDENARM
jgi:hypothetical protein